MKNEIEQKIFEKMKAKDFGESMCNETKLNILKWTMKQLRIHDVIAILPTESQLDEIAFRKFGNDPEGAIKFNLIKRMAFVEGCEFMLRLLKGN